MSGPRLIRRAARSAIRGAARDVTDRTAGRSALVIAPHPDDETLGCGATILRKVRAGAAVTVLVVTDGTGSHHSRWLPPEELGRLRQEEMTEAGRRLGLPGGAVRWAGLVDGSVAEHEDVLVGIIGGLLAELWPDEVYVTCAAEPHPDHAAVGRAARAAAQGAAVPVELLEYPVWMWGAWPLSRSAPVRSLATAAGLVLRRRARTVRTDGLVHAKLHALAAHAAQLARPAGVPVDEEWAVLPARVLADARDQVELFLPVR